MRKSLTALVLAASLGVASLTGCTPAASESTPTASPQSAADACKVAQESMKEFQEDMTTTLSEVTSGDFSTVVETMTSLQDKIGETADAISNTEVKSALNDFGAAIGKFTTVFDGVTDGDLTALTTKTAEMQEAGAAMQAAGEKLSKVCTL